MLSMEIYTRRMNQGRGLADEEHGPPGQSVEPHAVEKIAGPVETNPAATASEKSIPLSQGFHLRVLRALYPLPLSNPSRTPEDPRVNIERQRLADSNE